MSNEVSILSSEKEAAIAAMLGASQEQASDNEGSNDFLPVLKLTGKMKTMKAMSFAKAHSLSQARGIKCTLSPLKFALFLTCSSG